MVSAETPADPIDVARHLAAALDEQGQEYALGGALALGYWAAPRGTLDVDLTLYIGPERPGACIQSMIDADCDVNASEATRMIAEHYFFRAYYGEFRIDVFLPESPFYKVAKERRRQMDLDGQAIMVWDAETLAVFKMMFFREKDLVDVKSMLRTQGANFDRQWVREQLVDIFGKRDPRIARWDEIDRDVKQ